MTHTSCISHPAYNQCLKIHLWQVIACDGDVNAAALLSHIEALHNKKCGVDNHHKHVNDIAELHGKVRTLDENVLIPVKLPDLRASLFNMIAEKKISETLDKIVAKNFISIQTNPDPEKILDRTKYLRFHLEIVNAWIRENYNNDGSLVNPSCGQVIDSAKKETRFSEKAESILLKGGVDSVKKENRLCQKAESDRKESKRPNNNRQVVDISENAKREDRFGEKAESITPKGVCYNNINQSISINYNQDDCEFHDDQFEKARVTASDHSSVTNIVNALIMQGMSPEKFHYPDTQPELERLQQAGATIDIFIKAYGISAHATKGKQFGLRYLAKVVEGLLAKSKRQGIKNGTPISRSEWKGRTEPLSPAKEYVYENDFKNAASWAADLL